MSLQPARASEPVVLEGQYCRLEPLVAAHAQALFAAIDGDQAKARHQWLFEGPPANQQVLANWLQKVETGNDPQFFAVINKNTGLCNGRHALMNIVPANGTIEIGSVLWGEGIAKTRRATEAFYLTAKHIFDDLGYRRFEWKCNNHNLPSKKAATRFGFTFEGIFRQHMIVKGESRDTAWFSIIDSEWRPLKAALERWLHAANFDAEGIALTRLDTPRWQTEAAE